MISKIKISKKALFRITFLVILACGAFVLDNYFEDHPVNLDQVETSASYPTSSQGSFVLYSPSFFSNAKQSLPKIPFRFLHTEMHDKFLQKYHQLRNFHVLKAESINKNIPLFLSYHYLIFRNYYSSLPDDLPDLA